MIVLLAPALLVLFGERTFWVPEWLSRLLPHLDIEGGVDGADQLAYPETDLSSSG